MRYDAIFEWKMSPPEITAYKMAVLYETEYLKTFAGTGDFNFKENTIPRKGDPRKSFLFKQCWKLCRETRGLLNAEQYQNYIRANLMILKINKSRVSSNAICGDKAWIRWKVWERWYAQKLGDKASVAPPPSISTTDPKIIREIDRTKKFLFEKCDGEPTLNKIQDFLDKGFFKLWIAGGKVSIYYVMLSSYTKNHIDKLAEICSFDPLVFKQQITKEVKDYFNYEFKHESDGNRILNN